MKQTVMLLRLFVANGSTTLLRGAVTVTDRLYIVIIIMWHLYKEHAIQQIAKGGCYYETDCTVVSWHLFKEQANPHLAKRGLLPCNRLYCNALTP